jgi:hypothetical protein
MKSVRKRLTYANVMSSIAVFLVVAGGSALAANQLGKNTVGTKQLKSNAVTTAKIKNGAVTGSKIQASTLGTVPSATTAGTATNATNASHANSADTASRAADAANSSHANSADQASNANSLGGAPASAYARTELEAVHVVGAANQPAFEHGCTNGGVFGPVGFYKDPFGIVHLQGFLVGCTEGASAFTLPPGFRPPTTESVVVVDGTGNTSSGLIRVDPSGAVVPFGSSQGLISSVSFRTS